MGIGKWLQKQAQKDLEKWSRENPIYDAKHEGRPTNEYLFYINQNIIFGTRILTRIERILLVLLFAAGLALLKYLGLMQL